MQQGQKYKKCRYCKITKKEIRNQIMEYYFFSIKENDSFLLATLICRQKYKEKDLPPVDERYRHWNSNRQL
jgi:hypothetical protein